MALRKKVVLEKDIEAKVCKYAKDLGCLVRKMSGLGFAAWPDRMFITPKGHVFFIEFKRPGNKASPGQVEMLSELRARGLVAEIIDDIETGKGIVAGCCS